MEQAICGAVRSRVRLLVDLSRLKENYRRLSARLAAVGSEPIAVVKADAYGHGQEAVGAALFSAGARRFAVSSLSEGLALRATLPSAEILVLGYVPPEGAEQAAEAGLALTVHSLAYAKTVSRLVRRPLSVHIKLNSGMNRLGFPLHPLAFDAGIDGVMAAAALPRLCVVGIYSHLATADEEASPHTARQVGRFRAALLALARRGLTLPAHLSASAAVLSGGVPALPLARLGLGLYGYTPTGEEAGLLPVGRLVADIAQVYTLPRGEAVGYGAAYKTRRRERIGILGIGYADGLPRAAEGGLVRVGGVLCPLVGRISMDASAVLLSDAPRAAREAVLFGEQAGDLYRLSERAGTIPYEILSRLGKRVVREYQNGEDIRTCDPF